MNTITLRRPVLALALLVGSLVTVHAQAADAPAPAMRVFYGDLNLGREAGQVKLYGRLHAAAVNVCGDDGVAPLVEKARIRVCRDQAMQRAVAQIADPGFSAWYAAKTGRPIESTMVASR